MDNDSDEMLLPPEFSSNILSCILDHLEVSDDESNTWKTISLQLQDSGFDLFTEEKLKDMFESWCTKTKHEKRILEDLQIHDEQNEKNNCFLNSLEQRLLEYLENRSSNCKNDKIICRICLEEEILENTFRYIHIACSENNNMTIAEKILQCANVETISKENDFPQHICISCFCLLENAYKFKTLCETSNDQLRKTLLSKEEYVEYIIEDIFDLEEGSEEDGIAMNNLESFISNGDTEKSTIIVEGVEVLLPSDTKKNVKVQKNLDNNEHVIMSENSDLSSSNERKISKINTADAATESVKVNLCEICGMVCYNEDSLRKHLKTHSLKRPHRCTTCSKEFKTKLTLRVHMRSHTGERPYVCENCGKAFKTWSAITNHRATHLTVKMFKCPHCSYSGSTKANLQIHSRIHTGIQPYACSMCPLRFSTASNKNKHVKNVHEKLKLHKCTSCPRSFFSRESARKHMVIHTGLKPYTCPECPISYGWHNGLQKHMKSNHPNSKIPSEKQFINILTK